MPSTNAPATAAITEGQIQANVPAGRVTAATAPKTPSSPISTVPYRRSPSTRPASAASSAMITVRQANSTALSEVPKIPITHSRTAAGV
ncbi:Uncharacterised protein [Mycobacteroides abscessus subsp. abscessus]|nr:Uncharacterised protein [Mycobacteroides abscessus subsp. abscessus]